MSLLFMDGFDHYDALTYGSLKWDANPFTGGMSCQTAWFATGGRRNGAYVRLGAEWGHVGQYWCKTLVSNCATIIVGCAVKFVSITGSPQPYFMALYDGSTMHIGLKRNVTTGYLDAYRGDGMLLGTYSVPFSANVWYYFELKATIHDSNGILQFRVNEYLALDLSSIDTRNGANAYVNKIGFGAGADSGNQHTLAIDDLYVCDNSGANNNDFLGDCRIDVILPNGAGYATQWTPSAGSNYQCVDDALFDNGTDYVSEDTEGNQDTYAFADLPVGIAGIKGIQTSLFAKRTDSGVATKIKPVIRTGDTDYLKTEVTPTVNYYDYLEITEVNPATSAAWTKAELDDTEFGINLTSNPLE
jgi:hypothetical protein